MRSQILNFVVVGAILALSGAASGQQSDDQREVDSKHLQGTWVLESLDGKHPEHARKIRIEGDEVEGLFKDMRKHPLTLKYRLLPDRKIKGIDVGPFPAEYEGLEMRGIYSLHGGLLRLAFQPKLDARRPSPGYDLKEQRPTTFDPKLVQVQVWRRSKAD